MLQILHGSSEYPRSQEVKRLCESVQEDGMGDLNVTRYEGAKASIGEIINAANTLPFLTSRRLVVVYGLIKALGTLTKQPDPSSATAKLMACVSNLPETTDLVLVETETIRKNHPILKAAKELPNAQVKAYAALNTRRRQDRDELGAWLRREAKSLGVSLEGSAAALLTDSIGGDLRAHALALQKLAGHANYRGSITRQDVALLVPAGLDANIFALVDALGLKNRSKALDQLHALLDDGANELYILAMIARQIRQLIKAQALMGPSGRPTPELQEQLGIRHRFVYSKLLQQCRHFQPDELRAILGHILQVDVAVKTGRSPAPLALEMLVLRICAAPRRRA